MERGVAILLARNICCGLDTVPALFYHAA